MIYILRDKAFMRFLLKFLLVFAACYYGTLAWIGLTVPGGSYSPFIDKYLDYITWIRDSLLYGSKFQLSVFGIDTYIAGDYNLRMVNVSGLHL